MLKHKFRYLACGLLVGASVIGILLLKNPKISEHQQTPVKLTKKPNRELIKRKLKITAIEERISISQETPKNHQNLIISEKIDKIENELKLSSSSILMFQKRFNRTIFRLEETIEMVIQTMSNMKQSVGSLENSIEKIEKNLEKVNETLNKLDKEKIKSYEQEITFENKKKTLELKKTKIFAVFELI